MIAKALLPAITCFVAVFLVPVQAVNAQDLASFMHPEKLRGLCGDISSRTSDVSNPEEYSYAYERKFYEAAGVDFKTDTAASARAKLGYLWDHYQDRLKCDSSAFSVQRGSVLKYAFEMKMFGLIDTASRTWRLNLNVIDDTDRQTLLDFVYMKLAEYKGTDMEPTIANYVEVLRRYGAKRCTEFRPSEECRWSPKAPVTGRRR